MISKNLMMLALTPFILTTACAATPQREVSSTRTTPAIYSFESDASGFNTKNYFYDTGEEVIAFDTQFTPETARKSIEFLRTKTQNPITYAVITHPNPDKFNGMSVFQNLGAKVIASSATANSLKDVDAYKKYYFVNIAKMFSDANYPQLSAPDIIFDQNFDLKLRGGESIHLFELAKPGVSSNQTVASIPALNALIVGDLVHHKAHAWLEGGIVNGKPTPTLAGWIADLRELHTQFGARNPIVYGGRGEAALLNPAVSEQIAYLQKADSIVSAYTASVGKAELQGPNAGAHYAALQALFEKAFPDYALGYMIQYGVYGLVNSKL